MKIIECPRDAMQGMSDFIPTGDKVRYVNQLLKVGFDTLDVGSFVSPRAIPQMRDTSEVLHRIDTGSSLTKLLGIVANARGAEDACRHELITYLGFPLSLSETFQQRNTNQSIPQALDTLSDIQELCVDADKSLVIYISMGFGNPYGDPYDIDVVGKFVDILATLEIETISLADTVGVSTPDQIRYLFSNLTKDFPYVEFGAHLHAKPSGVLEKIDAAFESGCRRFDGAIKGLGGCPMAEDTLVGNVATETLLAFLESKSVKTTIDPLEFSKALRLADEIFPKS
jgi:hydroxymethylglutaryl-CoA lyase